MNEEVYPYLQQLHAFVQQQNTRITQLEQQLTCLTEEVTRLKNKPMTIEKIEYKFDQLKVETLEGTLNIGLNPLNESGTLQDFEIKNQKLNIRMNEYENPNIEEEVVIELHEYLDREGVTRIKQLEFEFRIELEDHHRELMLEDIRKQIEPRIPFYFSQMQQHPNVMSNPVLLKDTLLQKMKQDIDQAFVAFIQHFPISRKET